MLQTMIVILIVAAAAFFIGRRFYNSLIKKSSSTCGCGCDGCSPSQKEDCSEINEIGPN